ncbi:phosphatidic acid phosphatase type 2/haloperoxidase, partial [Chytridium lagenaria]
ALTFTYIQYSPHDPLGKPMALASLIPIFLIVSYTTLIIARRDAVIVLMLLGQLLNELTNYMAKKAIKQPRPTNYLGKGYGMPSSHAQFMAFFAVFLMSHYYISSIQKHAIALLTTFIALSVAYSRIHLNYHTTPQVIAGYICGTLFGLTWFIICEVILHPAIKKSEVMEWNAVRWLCIRDTRWIGDVTRCEYEAVVRELKAGKLQ